MQKEPSTVGQVDSEEEESEEYMVGQDQEVLVSRLEKLQHNNSVNDFFL